jgi:hypothetical protein
MANRAFAPTDINLFNQVAFPWASVPQVAPGQGPDEATAGSQLDHYLGQKVSLGLINTTERSRIMGLYAASSTKAIIPNPNLRAGLLSLSGTSASGAIGKEKVSGTYPGRKGSLHLYQFHLYQFYPGRKGS